MKMCDYPNLFKYYNQYRRKKGRPEHSGCFPNLIIWIREALDDDQWKITDLLEMDDDEKEEFGSWGTNSRWAHVVEPLVEELLLGNDSEQRKWMKDILLEIAGQYGDPDVEAKYFANKKD